MSAIHTFFFIGYCALCILLVEGLEKLINFTSKHIRHPFTPKNISAPNVKNPIDFPKKINQADNFNSNPAVPESFELTLLLTNSNNIIWAYSFEAYFLKWLVNGNLQIKLALSSSAEDQYIFCSEPQNASEEEKVLYQLFQQAFTPYSSITLMCNWNQQNFRQTKRVFQAIANKGMKDGINNGYLAKIPNTDHYTLIQPGQNMYCDYADYQKYIQDIARNKANASVSAKEFLFTLSYTCLDRYPTEKNPLYYGKMICKYNPDLNQQISDYFADTLHLPIDGAHSWQDYIKSVYKCACAASIGYRKGSQTAYRREYNTEKKHLITSKIFCRKAAKN